MNKESIITVLLLLSVSVGIAVAQSNKVASASSEIKEADLKAGELITKEGTKAGATACFACHGMKGGENLSGAFPRIASQPAMYLSSQLKDYATGVRLNDVMEPIAKALTEEERENVAAYYASLDLDSKSVAKKAKAADIKRGETLAVVGDAKIRMQACNNCHGPGGIGMAPAIPYIAGQFGSYIEAQLKSWKEGRRKNSPGQMLDISQRLNEKDIAALAAYFEQVQRAFPKKASH